MNKTGAAMKALALLVALSAIVALPAMADENDAMRQCLAFEMRTGRYRSSDPQAPYRLLEACSIQWQQARLRVMRERNITEQTADEYMVATLRDLIAKSGS
jgi:hypothetical protein